ncbi:hypothetical protein BC828DRAFT_382237 [Blastocladiella britannica]|nr:hypothetical protein BC828DRAFT_382237 [Blastocladiella britannica]
MDTTPVKERSQRVSASAAFADQNTPETDDVTQRISREVRDVRKQLDHFERLEGDVKSTIERHKSRIQALTVEKSRLETEVRTKDNVIRDLNAHLDRCRTALDNAQKRSDSLEVRHRMMNDLERKARDADTLRAQLAATRTELSDLQASLRSLESDLKNIGQERATLAQQLTASQEQLEGVQTVLQSTRAELNTLTTRHAAVKQQLENAVRGQASTREALDAKRIELARVLREVDDLRVERNTAEEDATALATRVKDLADELTAEIDARERAEAALAASDTDRRGLEAKIDRVVREATDVQARTAALTAERDHLQRQLAAAQQDAKSKDTLIAAERQAAAVARTQRDDAVLRESALRERADESDAAHVHSREEYTSQLTNLQTSLAEVTTQRNELHTDYIAMRENRSELQNAFLEYRNRTVAELAALTETIEAQKRDAAQLQSSWDDERCELTSRAEAAAAQCASARDEIVTARAKWATDMAQVARDAEQRGSERDDAVAKLGHLREEVARVLQARDGERDRADKAASALAGATARLEQLQSEKAILAAQLLEARHQLDETRRGLGTAVTERAALDAELDTLRADLATRTQELNAARGQIDDLIATLAAARDAHDAQASEWTMEQQQLAVEVNETRSVLATTTAELKSTQSCADQLAHTATLLNGTTGQLEQQLSDAKARQTALESDLAEARQQAADLRSKVSALDAQLGASAQSFDVQREQLVTELEALRAQVTDGSDERDQLAGELGAVLAQVAALESERDAAVAAAAEKDSELSSSRLKISELTEVLVSATQETDKLVLTLESNQADAMSSRVLLEDRLLVLQRRAELAEGDLATLTLARDDLQSRLDAISSEHQDAMHRSDEYAGSLMAELEQTRSTHSKELAAAAARLSELEALRNVQAQYEAELTTRLDAALQQAKDAETEAALAHEAEEQCMTELLEHQEAMATATARLASFESDLATSEQALHEATTTAAHVARKLHNRDQELNAALDKVAHLEALLGEKAESMTAAQESLAAQIAGLEHMYAADREAWTTERARLESALVSTSEAKAELEASLAQFKQEVAALQTDLAAHRADLESLRSAEQEAKNTASAEQRRAEAALAQVVDLSSQLASTHEQSSSSEAAARAARNALASDLESYKVDLASASASLDSATARVSELERELTNHQYLATVDREKMELLLAQTRTQLQDMSAAHHSAADAWQRREAHLEATLEEMQSELGDAQAALDEPADDSEWRSAIQHYKDALSSQFDKTRALSEQLRNVQFELRTITARYEAAQSDPWVQKYTTYLDELREYEQQVAFEFAVIGTAMLRDRAEQLAASKLAVNDEKQFLQTLDMMLGAESHDRAEGERLLLEFCDLDTAGDEDGAENADPDRMDLSDSLTKAKTTATASAGIAAADHLINMLRSLRTMHDQQLANMLGDGPASATFAALVPADMTTAAGQQQQELLDQLSAYEDVVEDLRSTCDDLQRANDRLEERDSRATELELELANLKREYADASQAVAELAGHQNPNQPIKLFARIKEEKLRLLDELRAAHRAQELLLAKVGRLEEELDLLRAVPPPPPPLHGHGASTPATGRHRGAAATANGAYGNTPARSFSMLLAQSRHRVAVPVHAVTSLLPMRDPMADPSRASSSLTHAHVTPSRAPPQYRHGLVRASTLSGMVAIGEGDQAIVIPDTPARAESM